MSSTHVQTGVTYVSNNCTGVTPKGPVGPMMFRTTIVDLDKASLTPAIPASGLASLDQMLPPNAVAGINGGYFFRTDARHFVDDVCWGKTKEEALKPVSASHPNYGLGDGLVIKDGVLLSSNCNCIGNSVPALLVINGTGSHILVQTRGAPAPKGVVNGIAAGPNLVSEDESGRPFIDIEGLNVNIIEHSANTAVALLRRPSAKAAKNGKDAATKRPVYEILDADSRAGSEKRGLFETSENADANVEGNENGNAEQEGDARQGTEMGRLVMVTSDGFDGCNSKNVTCGLNAIHMAYFMLDAVKANQAMEMDQGGSTTMWVKGKGIVSNPGAGTRNIFSSLFVVEESE